MRNIKLLSALFIILFVASGCKKEESMLITSPEDMSSDEMTLEKNNGNVSAVFTQNNSPSGNEVYMYKRSGKGSLSSAGSYSTGGTGTGAGLGSQGALVLNGRYLFVVNAGSNDVSIFSANKSGLTLIDKEASGGTMPISVTVYKNLLYILNAGTPANITGFTVGKDGSLTMIPGSTRPLSNPSPGPAQVEFSPDGNFLVVTEKATNMISTFVVMSGLANGPVSQPSAGATPFGFAFDKRGNLIVSEAFGGAPLAGAMSSYNVSGAGSSLITGPVYNQQTAPCWVVITKNNKFAYTSNTGTGNISGYNIDKNGSISLFNDGGNTASTGPGSSPIDMALSNNSQYLYALGASSHEINVFRINNGSGALTLIDKITAPTGSVGLAAN